MNQFKAATKDALKRNGKLGTYIQVTAGVYNIETGSTVSNPEVNYEVLMYEKHIKTTQYNYPSLIGKQVSLFYVSSDDIPEPQVKDVIDFSSTRFTVDSYSRHMAHGEVVMYKIVAVRT